MSWQKHIKQTRVKNPNKSFKECLKIASKTYTKKENKQKGNGLLKGLRGILASVPGSVKRMTRSHGDKKITSIDICRTPVLSKYQKALNLVTLGGVNAVKQKYSYDDIYHLFLVLTFENGDRYSIEKNQVVKIHKNPRPGGECKSARTNGSTFANMMSQANIRHGDGFYRYSAHKNNCQAFVRAIANALGAQSFNSFISQNTDQLLPKGIVRSAVQLTTDTAGLAARAVGGGKKRRSKK